MEKKFENKIELESGRKVGFECCFPFEFEFKLEFKFLLSLSVS